jgi:predicted O-methyltransferase YrrM
MTIKYRIIRLAAKLPYVGRLFQEHLDFKRNSCFPPGHYYSPIISIDDIRMRENEIWAKSKIDGVIGIDLNTQTQIDLLKNSLSAFYHEMPFSFGKQAKIRYYFDNGFYTYTDGIILYSMIRHFKPKRIIEIGSGFSSAVMLDTNELFFNNQIKLSFIEPYPERLLSLINENDVKTNTIIESDVQSINLQQFEELDAGDILFIDSTHVVKTASDVNYILFEILPKLKSGVLIHFHDVFYPFEYPKEWVFVGRNWNEAYFLKAFLMYNDDFEIKFFADYMHEHHKESFSDMPLTYRDHGSNFWLEKK